MTWQLRCARHSRQPTQQQQQGKQQHLLAGVCSLVWVWQRCQLLALLLLLLLSCCRAAMQLQQTLHQLFTIMEAALLLLVVVLVVLVGLLLLVSIWMMMWRWCQGRVCRGWVGWCSRAGWEV
jgi:uncharacterized membrane protein YdbT with pleckstrin-like domain